MKKIQKLIFIPLCLLLTTKIVKADVTATDMEITDFSIEPTATYTADDPQLTLTLNYPEKTNNDSYYVIFVETETSPKPNINDYINTDDNTLKINLAFNTLSKLATSNRISINDDWYLAKDYEWAYIIKETINSSNKTYKITSSPIKVEKPALRGITERYQVSNFNNDESLAIISLFPHTSAVDISKYGDHKLTTKIGKVTDNSILRKIRDEVTDGYSNLLTYAKNNNNGISDTYDDNARHILDLNGLTINNDSYYYVYTTYTDTKYRNIEGISLVMGQNNKLTTELTWNVSLEDSNVKNNEQTGTTAITIAWIIGFIAIVFTIMYFRQTIKNEV